MGNSGGQLEGPSARCHPWKPARPCPVLPSDARLRHERAEAVQPSGVRHRSTRHTG